MVSSFCLNGRGTLTVVQESYLSQFAESGSTKTGPKVLGREESFVIRPG